MAFPDLVDTATVQTLLAERGLTAAELAALPQLITAASANMRVFLRRIVSSWVSDECYTVGPSGREIFLRQIPVLGIESVRGGLTPVLNVSNSSGSVQRAVVTLATGGDPTESPAPVGLNLTAWRSAVKSSTAVTFTLNPTLAALAAAINLLGGGWLAVVTPGYELWPALDLRAVQGGSASSGRSIDFGLHATDLDYAVDERTGVLTLGTEPGLSTQSPRWGPAWSNEFVDVVSFGGGNGVRVVYTAGWSVVPADIVTGVVDTVKSVLDTLKMDYSLQSESDGTISWSGRPLVELAVIPLPVQRSLSQRVNHRA